MKSCTLLDMSLLSHEARFPDAGKHLARKRKRPRGQHSDPRTGTTECPCLVGVGPGVHYTKRVADCCKRGTSTRAHVPPGDVIEVCLKLLEVHMGSSTNAWWKGVADGVQDDHTRILLQCKAVLLHRCRLSGFLMSSALSGKLLSMEGKSEASSYCLVRPQAGAPGQPLVPAFVHFYLLVQWQDPESTIDRMARVCLIKEEDASGESILDDAAFCSHVWRFDPGVGMGPERNRWIRVAQIERPVILIKRKQGLSVSKLVQFEGRLCGSYDDNETVHVDGE
jgi:hypothetical protein